MSDGRLVLVPLPLDFGCPAPSPLTDVLPALTLQWAARLPCWVCENARTLRAFLQRVHGLQRSLQRIEIRELPRSLHKKGDPGTAASSVLELLQPALDGRDLGLASEAGMPAVADPGGSLVRAAHDRGIEVIPLVGPPSLLLALAASGLNGQSFAYAGYLPQEAEARATRARALEQQARRSGQTQVLIETPYRNLALIDTLLRVLQPDTRLAVCAGLTLPGARTVSASVAAWRRNSWRPAKDQPAVFLIGT